MISAQQNHANLWLSYVSKMTACLELRQYKNNSIQSKIILILKLPLFFITYTAREKARQFKKWNIFVLNGIVLTLF